MVDATTTYGAGSGSVRAIAKQWICTEENEPLQISKVLKQP